MTHSVHPSPRALALALSVCSAFVPACGGGGGNTPLPDPLPAPTAASLRDLDARPGYLRGTLHFTHAANEDALTAYVVHFADEAGEPIGAPIATLPLEGSEGAVELVDGTEVPAGATHIRLFGTNGVDLSSPGLRLPPSDLAARRVLDTFPGEYEWGYPHYLAVHQDRLYFACHVEASSAVLCRLDETGEDFEVLDPAVQPMSELASIGDALYFIGNAPETGSELYRYTVAGGVELVGEIVAGAGDGAYLYPGDRVTLFEGALYFGGRDEDGHFELFRHTSEGGFEQVSHYVHESPNVGGMTIFDGRLYYYADEGLGGYRLIWYTNEDDSTVVSGANSYFGSEFENFVVAGTRMYFTAQLDGSSDLDLFWLDGDHITRANQLAAGARVSPIFQTGGELLLITETDAAVGHEWHRVTAAGELTLIADLNPGSGLDDLFDEVYPRPYVSAWGEDFVMVGATSTDSSSFAWQNLELFLWDGVGPPVQVLEIGPTETTIDEFAGWDDSAIENFPSWPTGFTQLGERMYFGASDYFNGHELWVIERL